MRDRERKAIIDRVLSVNLVYYKNRQYLQLLNTLVPYASDSAFDISLMFEMKRVNEHQKVIKEYIKREVAKLIGVRYFGEVLGSEIIEDTITYNPIECISHAELKDGKILLNELVVNSYKTHFIGTKALVLYLNTGQVISDKDTQRCKIIKIPKVALS